MINIKFAGLGEPYERCCFCRRHTDYWYNEQIAVCHFCATVANEEDIPEKADWVRKEEIATHADEMQAQEDFEKQLLKIEDEKLPRN